MGPTTFKKKKNRTSKTYSETRVFPETHVSPGEADRDPKTDR